MEPSGPAEIAVVVLNRAGDHSAGCRRVEHRRLGFAHPYKADLSCALYAVTMKSSGDVRVSQRGQMSLPAEARHRWGLDGGGEVGYLDVGEAVILIPGGVDNLRQRLFEALTEEDWVHARDGHGDPDLANE